MSRPHKPWHRKSRGYWCVEIDGNQHNLGPDEDEARRKYNTLMAERPVKPSASSIATLLDAFVVYSEEHKAASTARWYENYLQDFIDYLKANSHRPATMSPARLTPRIVRVWADERGAAKRGRITAVKAAYRWAHEEGWINSNPIGAMKRPPETKREEIVSLAEMKAILRLSDKPFRDLLVVSWDTGARPPELRKLRDFHVDLPNHRCVLSARESKGKKRNRVIYLTRRAERIIKRLNTGGHVFRNSKDKPWTTTAVNCRFARLEEKLGRRFCQYLFRHSFATRKLKEGISPIVVAELLGHADVSTLAKVYQHVAQDPGHLLAAISRWNHQARPAQASRARRQPLF